MRFFHSNIISLYFTQNLQNVAINVMTIFWCIGLIIVASDVVRSTIAAAADSSHSQSMLPWHVNGLLNFSHSLNSMPSNDRYSFSPTESNRLNDNEHSSVRHMPNNKLYSGRAYDGDRYRHKHKNEWLNGNQWFNYQWSSKQHHRNAQHLDTAQPSVDQLTSSYDNNVKSAIASSMVEPSSVQSHSRWMRMNASSNPYISSADEFSFHTKRHSKRKHHGTKMQFIDSGATLSRHDSSVGFDTFHMHHEQNRLASKLYASAHEEMSDANSSTSIDRRPHWPIKKEAIMEGDLILGGLMMVHSREDLMMCGPIMPQGTD